MIRTVLNYMLMVAIVLGMAACKADPPEQRLRQTIAAMQEAVEAGRPKDFMASVAPDFVGNEGLDHAGLHNLLKAQLLLNSKVAVQTGPVSVDVQGEVASVRFSVLLAGGNRGLLPERGQMQEVVSGWREQDGQWQLYSASWEPVGR